MEKNEILINKLLENGYKQNEDSFTKNEITIKSREASRYPDKRTLIVREDTVALTFIELPSSIELFDEALDKAHFFLSDYDNLIDEFMDIQRIKSQETLVYNILRKNLSIAFHQHMGMDCMKAQYEENILSKKDFPHINPIWWRTSVAFSLVQFEARSMEMKIHPRDSFNMGLDALILINEMYAQQAFLKSFLQIKEKVKRLLMTTNFNI